MLNKGPLKKGDVRAAIDKRIEASRRRRAKLSPGDDEGGKSVEKAKESVLQSLRKELLGEPLANTPKT